MPKDDDKLGDRFKQYEAASQSMLSPRMPVIIRVDGKAFHTYTKGTQKPVDINIEAVMNITALKLCNELQGVQLAYAQSDEISLFLHGYKRFTTQPWFDNKVQKMVSVAASIAAATFTMNSWKIWFKANSSGRRQDLNDFIRPAYFDARAFCVPEDDVRNYFLWRQKDWIRNSVQLYGRHYFSSKQLHGKSNVDVKQMMLDEHQFDWDKLPGYRKFGRVILNGKINDAPDFREAQELFQQLLEKEI